MSIEVTETAVQEAARLRAKEGAADGSFLRIGVKGGGCSGFAYVLKWVEEQRPDDLVIDKPGLKLLVDPKSLTFLDGMVLDFSGGLMGQGLVFRNPNAKASCGCGKSFGV
jgi:iron-sulfur cluster assembly protein